MTRDAIFKSIAFLSVFQASPDRERRREKSRIRSKRPRFASLTFETLESRELLSVQPFGDAPRFGETSEISPLSVANEIASRSFDFDSATVAASDSLPTSSEPRIVTTALDVADPDDGLLSLREAIVLCGGGETITFDASLAGQTIRLDGAQLEIAKGLTIDASALYDAANGVPGITIDANRSSRVFYISAGSLDDPVRLTGLAITGGADSFGAGIYQMADAKNSSLTLEDCVISDNSATSDGGGIYNFGRYATAELTLIRCVVSENSANSGGGVYNRRFSATANATFLDCRISNNSASLSGGGIVNSGNAANVINSLIANNSAVGQTYAYAGGISNLGSTTLTNCSVVGNVANYYSGGLWNFGSESASVSLRNSIVALNKTQNSISDVYQNVSNNVKGSIVAENVLSSYANWTRGSNNLTYNESTPLFNDAETGDYSLSVDSPAVDAGNNGFAVDYNGIPLPFDLTGNERINNNVVDLGAFEYIAAVLTVTTNLDVVDPNDGVLSLREAISQAAARDSINFDASLAGQTIVLNGTRLVIDKPISIDASSLFDAENGVPGLTIDAAGRSSVLSVSGGTKFVPVSFSGLALTGGKTAWYGGILYNVGTTKFRRSSFENGFAYYGGAVANEGTLTLADCDFTNNKASFGAAVFNRATGTLDVSELTATANFATNYGGVLYNNGSANVSNARFETNVSNNRGGAIYVGGGSVVVDSTVFLDNTAKNFAGSIYNDGNIDISNSSISGSSAIYGGAIANFKTATITDCDFAFNSATRFGGAIYSSSQIAANIDGGTISDNSALQGGGLYVRVGTVRLIEIEMKRNAATNNGGAIYNKNQVVLTDCVLTDNVAKYYGGGIYNEKIVRLNASTIVAENSTESGRSPNIRTKAGGQVVISSELADSVFDEFDAEPFDSPLSDESNFV